MIDLRLVPYAIATLRIALGLMFIAHAWLKVTVFIVRASPHTWRTLAMGVGA